MQSTDRSATSLLYRCTFLLIAFAVFAFVLHARLAQYKPCPPNPTASKVAAGRRPTLLPAAEATADDPIPPTAFRLKPNCFLPMYPIGREAAFSRVEAASVALGNPVRFDLHGAYFLHRPPPTRS